MSNQDSVQEIIDYKFKFTGLMRRIRVEIEILRGIDAAQRQRLTELIELGPDATDAELIVLHGAISRTQGQLRLLDTLLKYGEMDM